MNRPIISDPGDEQESILAGESAYGGKRIGLIYVSPVRPNERFKQMWLNAMPKEGADTVVPAAYYGGIDPVSEEDYNHFYHPLGVKKKPKKRGGLESFNKLIDTLKGYFNFKEE